MDAHKLQTLQDVDELTAQLAQLETQLGKRTEEYATKEASLRAQFEETITSLKAELEAQESESNTVSTPHISHKQMPFPHIGAYYSSQ